MIESQARKSLIRQHDQSDCGVACLATIIRYYNGYVPLESLRQMSGTTKDGTTLLGLYHAGESLGFDVLGLEAEGIENLEELNCPSILNVLIEGRLSHYIVFFGFEKGKIIVGDPDKGISKYSHEELNGIWVDKTLLKLTPNANFSALKSDRDSKFRWLLKSVRSDFHVLLIALSIGVVTSVLGLTTAIFTQRLIDDILPSGNQKRLFAGLVLVVILLAARSLLSYLRGLFIIHHGKKYNNRIVSEFYSSLIDAPKSFFDTRKIGDLTARLNDTDKIQSTLSIFLSNFLVDLLLIIISAVFICVYSWVLGLIVIGFFGIYILLAINAHNPILQAQRNVLANYAVSESNYIDTIQGIMAIKGLQREEHFKKTGQTIYQALQDKIFKLGKSQIRLLLSVDIFGVLFMSTILSVSSWFVLVNDFKVGELVAVVAMAGNFVPSVTSLIAISIQIKQAQVALERMLEFSMVGSEHVNDSRLPAFQAEVINSIVVRNLSFRFVGRESILTDITLQAHRGELVVIMGQSGCGKSTFLQVLQKFYQQESGEININNVPLDQISTAQWRGRVGVVPQDVKIFNGTVLYNLVLSENEVDYEEVVAFCVQFGFDSYFQLFPQGYNTLIGEEGINISGGQKQIIALVRVLYRRPEILLLDEATSAMDNVTEDVIINLLNGIRKKMIVFFVTHRTSVARTANRIYTLRDGRAFECTRLESNDS